MLRASQMMVLSVFGLTSPSFAGEAADAAALFRDICLATEGDLVVAKERAQAHGFEFQNGVGNLAGVKQPSVVLTPASGNVGHDKCALHGETVAEEAIAATALSKGLVEVPAVGQLFEGMLVRTFVSRECAEASEFFGSCELIQFLGDERPGPSSTPFFRTFNYVPSRKPVS
ncbi:hypothetical protein [Aminobacter ciceronei]|jgi:hypothetical protein|uniref:hypothetical protein n=1 Tax=Aminobacter ciceronei TaxID=150723 RepID=UPI003F6E9007